MSDRELGRLARDIETTEKTQREEDGETTRTRTSTQHTQKERKREGEIPNNLYRSQ